MDKDNKKLDKDNKKLDKVNKGEKPILKNYRCSGYTSNTTNLHPYLTESAMKDLDDIFWID